MVLNLKKGLQFDQQMRFKVNVFLAISLIYTSDIYSVTLSKLLSSESFVGDNGKSLVGWKRPKGRHGTTYAWCVEKELPSRTICLHSDLRKAQDRTGWRRLVATTMIWHGICKCDDDDYDDDDDDDDIYDR